MGAPTKKVEVQFFAPADAQAKPVEVVPDMGLPLTDEEQAAAEELATVATTEQPEPPADTVTVGLLPVWGYAVAWIITVIAFAQAIKWVLRAVGIKDKLGSRGWKRWLMVWPIVAGTALAAGYGPLLAAQFGLQLDRLAAVVFLGPGSGMAATFAYDFVRGVVLPLLPDTVVGIIERISGVALPDETKERAQLPSSMTTDSEAVMLEEARFDAPTIPDKPK